MTIRLTNDQWADVLRNVDAPPRVSDPAEINTFVLVRLDAYDERLKALFENDPITPLERLSHLQQFGQRAGWNDPAMDVYDELDPRRTS